MAAAVRLEGMRGETAAVMTSLADAIERGELPPGSRLPSQTELCARYSVTRPTISKVVGRLVEEGMVSVRKGTGVFVLRPDPVPVASASRTVAVMMTMTPEAYAAVQKHLVPKGFMPAVYSQAEHDWNPALERQFLQTVLTNRVRGLVAFCSPIEPHNADLLADIERHGTRVVHIEPFSPSLPREGYIVPDYVRAGRIAAVEVARSGYLTVRVVSSSEAPYVDLMVEGVRQGLADHAPEVEMDVVCWKGTAIKSRERDMEEWIGESRGKACALVCLGPWVLSIVRRHLAGSGLAESWPLGLMAVDFESSDETVDSLVLSHREAMAEALDWILSETAEPPRRLLAPRLVRFGSLREPAAG